LYLECVCAFPEQKNTFGAVGCGICGCTFDDKIGSLISDLVTALKSKLRDIKGATVGISLPDSIVKKLVVGKGISGNISGDSGLNC